MSRYWHFPSPAAARERDVPQAGPLPAGYSPGDVRDDVIPAEAPLMRVARSTTHARTLSTADGYQIEVEVSSAYPDDPAADQALVDFLGSRLHGAELGGLRVYVGTPREISRFCGSSQVVACYAVDEARIYVPGEKVDGMPVEYPLTHEYGHHVAVARSSKRWNALNWGAKNWARATNVCAHVKGGDLFPGNQGAHYFDDPGEGFADGYAHLHYPKARWQYNDLMRPNRSVFAAIRRDVLHPSAGNGSRTFRALGTRRGADVEGPPHGSPQGRPDPHGRHRRGPGRRPRPIRSPTGSRGATTRAPHREHHPTIQPEEAP